MSPITFPPPFSPIGLDHFDFDAPPDQPSFLQQPAEPVTPGGLDLFDFSLMYSDETSSPHAPQQDITMNQSLPLGHHHVQHSGVSGASDSPMPPPPRPQPSQTTKPRKPKSRTLREKDWEPVKARIIELHISQDQTLPSVMDQIKQEFDFEATQRQYINILKKWNLGKNIRNEEMKAIVRKRQQRRLAEKNKPDLLFRVRDQVVPPQKIDRWMAANSVAADDMYDAGAETPEGLTCWTPHGEAPSPGVRSSRGTPGLAANASVSTPRYMAVSPAPPFTGGDLSSNRRFGSQSPGPGRSAPNEKIHSAYGAHEELRLKRGPAALEEQHGRDHRKTLDALQQLGVFLLNQGRYQSAEQIPRRLVSAQRKFHGDNAAQTAWQIMRLGRTLRDQGRFQVAEELFRRAFGIFEQALGMEHAQTLTSMIYLANILADQGRLKEAEQMHRQALAGCRKLLGDDDPLTRWSIVRLGHGLNDQGRHEEAEELLRQARESHETTPGEENSYTLGVMEGLARALGSQGRYDEAKAMYQRVLTGWIKIRGKEHPLTLFNMDRLAHIHAHQGLFDQAECMFRTTLDLMRKVFDQADIRTLTCMDGLVRALAGQDKDEEAAELRRQLSQLREMKSREESRVSELYWPSAGILLKP
ncbi:hypothetical protein QBC46DRAFT_352996 [Diplogelasinospora grovesii]|uniref:Clr5 domain-containing protein n=1 Tax=Diplogelasinospora grovesii TaxID=303347 RepID=A0AAN6N9Q2_9PEZI|nr:hypothetical protein QBC46DRAFT_352996 [Diplogelasinospora grovesii]